MKLFHGTLLLALSSLSLGLVACGGHVGSDDGSQQNPGNGNPTDSGVGTPPDDTSTPPSDDRNKRTCRIAAQIPKHYCPQHDPGHSAVPDFVPRISVANSSLTWKLVGVPVAISIHCNLWKF